MSYKTILVHWDAGPASRHRLDMAADLAQRFGSHLIGLYTRPTLQVRPVADEDFPPGDFYRAYAESAEADQVAAAAAFTDAIGPRTISSAWRVIDGADIDAIVAQSRYADLVVIGRRAATGGRIVPADLPETVAFDTGKPVLVVPRFDAGHLSSDTILLCWNDSREAARAASEALPLLQAARRVVVLVATPVSMSSAMPPETLAASSPRQDGDSGASVAVWLRRHGVEALVQRETTSEADVADLILARAAEWQAGVIVMGVYGHSRLREFVLGGTSRAMLADTGVPLLIAH
jgi:nucleotide-binding universal stress UspA family protein